MLNDTQEQLLEEMLGPEGFYYQAIIENPDFDLGTKSLYLKLAITQECHDFLVSLDKLYDGSKSSLDLIRNLKVINDLCFNNDMLFDPYGVRSALPHFFGRIGPDPSLTDFQPLIKQHIQARLTHLQQSQEAEFLEQQSQARDILENRGAGQMMWRTLLALPAAQLETQPVLETQPAPELSNYSDIINTINLYYYNYNITIINTFLNTPFINNEELGQDLTEDEISQLDAPIRQQIFDHPQEIHQLTHVFHATFEQLRVLSSEEFQFIRTHLDAIRFLVRMEFHTLSDIINMSAHPRTQCLEQAQLLADKFESLNDNDLDHLKTEGIAFETLCNLNQDELQIIIDDPKSEQAMALIHPPSAPMP